MYIYVYIYTAARRIEFLFLFTLVAWFVLLLASPVCVFVSTDSSGSANYAMYCLQIVCFSFILFADVLLRVHCLSLFNIG